MKKTIFLIVLMNFLFWGCAPVDHMAKIRELEGAGKVLEAKQMFKTYVDEKKDPNLERDFIVFLFQHEQFQDFKTRSEEFLAQHPGDKIINKYVVDYYGKMASDCERTGQYDKALDHIHGHLLDPEFSDVQKWESRQSDILRKWFKEGKDEADEMKQKAVLNKIKSLGLDNLGRSLDAEEYDKLQ